VRGEVWHVWGCPDMSIYGLRVVSAPHLAAVPPSAVPCSWVPPLVAFYLAHRALACHSWRCLDSLHGLAMRWPFASVLCRACPLLHQIARCLGLKCLEFCSGGFLSPTRMLDAGSTLSHDRCSTHNRQRSPSFMRVNARGFDVPHIRGIQVR
jgi:hypothetical protein